MAELEELAIDAFGHYTDRIGRRPAPMTADYAKLLATARVWVIVADDRVAGMLITESRSDHLHPDIIAVARGAQGAGHGSRLLRRAEQDAEE